MKRHGAALAALLLLAACGQSNPLIGEWEAEGGAAEAIAGLGGDPNLAKAVFTEETMTISGTTYKVTYEVRDDDTVVVKAEGQPIDLVFKVSEEGGTTCITSDMFVAMRYCRT
jgi:major membrane immunogen (membrane-anchored lipoprotein)